MIKKIIISISLMASLFAQTNTTHEQLEKKYKIIVIHDLSKQDFSKISNKMKKRSKIYANEIKKQAKKQEIPASLVFAIIHSESAFNPMGRSTIPSYGLMGIIPRTHGVDAYKYLYNKRKLPSSSYLYNATNNIKIGSAYLHILYYRYLKKIKDTRSRLYCAVVAYSSGPGNVAYAFTKKYNIGEAAPLINKLTSEEVYNKLLKDLKYKSDKIYLKKVSKRMSAYHEIYGN